MSPQKRRRIACVCARARARANGRNMLEVSGARTTGVPVRRQIVQTHSHARGEPERTCAAWSATRTSGCGCVGSDTTSSGKARSSSSADGRRSAANCWTGKFTGCGGRQTHAVESTEAVVKTAGSVGSFLPREERSRQEWSSESPVAHRVSRSVQHGQVSVTIGVAHTQAPAGRASCTINAKVTSTRRSTPLIRPESKKVRPRR